MNDHDQWERDQAREHAGATHQRTEKGPHAEACADQTGFDPSSGRYCCDDYATWFAWSEETPHRRVAEGRSAVHCPVENVTAFDDGPDGCSACGAVITSPGVTSDQ